MEPEFNEQNSLELIESMINKARNNFSESGTLYLFWGIVIFVCSMTQFIAVYFFNNQNIYYIWILTWVAVVYQIFFLSKKAKKEKVKTYTADILKYIWICFGVLMLLFLFILQYKKVYDCLDPAILAIYGMPTFLAGFILKFKSLVIGGIACWLLAIGCLFVPIEFHALFICAAVVIAWIVPGYLLRKKFKNQP